MSSRPVSAAVSAAPRPSVCRASCVTALTLPWRLSRRRAAARLGAVPVLAVLLTPLAGCGTTDPYAFPPACPQYGTVPEAAEVTQFRGPGKDLTDMAIEARITAPHGHCSREQDGRLKIDTYVRMRVTRGPAAAGRTEPVDYFIAVVDASGRILSKSPLRALVEFPPNVDRVDVTGETLTLSLPTRKDRTGEAFTLLSGFQLTPAQLAFNRGHGAR